MPYKDPEKQRECRKRSAARRTPEQKAAQKTRQAVYMKAYRKTEKYIAYNRAYLKSERGKESIRRSAEPRAERNREIIEMLKLAPCLDCGNQFPSCCMEFDHARGKKKMSIGSMGSAGRTEKALRNELAKCDVVCANCHCIRTRIRNQQNPRAIIPHPLSATLTLEHNFSQMELNAPAP